MKWVLGSIDRLSLLVRILGFVVSALVLWVAVDYYHDWSLAGYAVFFVVLFGALLRLESVK